MTYSPELLDAVAALDADSRGWHRKINLGTFELANSTCVLAQVYGSVDSGKEMIDCANTLALRTTVSINPIVFCDWPGENTNEDQWRALIAERQEADRIGETLSIPELDEVEGVPV